MRISAKIDYACRALLELSLHWPNEAPLQISTISQKQDIPVKFLTQILINLKQLGYVQSIRGKKGGYRLAKSPNEITLRELITHLGNVGYSVSENRKEKKEQHVMSLIWMEIDEMVLEAMEKITFETICHRKRSSDNTVMFDI